MRPAVSSTVRSLASVPSDWITPVIRVMSAQMRSTTRPARSALMITLDPSGQIGRADGPPRQAVAHGAMIRRSSRPSASVEDDQVRADVQDLAGDRMEELSLRREPARLRTVRPSAAAARTRRRSALR